MRSSEVCVLFRFRANRRGDGPDTGTQSRGRSATDHRAVPVGLFHWALCLLLLGFAPAAGSASFGTAPACVAPRLDALETGFTLTHRVVDGRAEAACAADPAGGASIHGADNLIAGYTEPAFRSEIRSLLREMAADGATVLRTILWYRHAEDEAMAIGRPDPLGLHVASGGRLPSSVLDNLRQLAADAEEAGYRRLVLVLGPQGTSNPRCRGRSGWGSCFDDRLMKPSWSVTKQVIDTMRGGSLAGIGIVFDIAPETCADPASGLQVDGNLDRYSRYMLARYAESFGDSRFIVSCGAGNAERASRGLRAQVQLLRETGSLPAAIDVHVYDTDPGKVDAILTVADEVAAALGVPLDVNETYYDHPALFPVVRDGVYQGRFAALRSVLVFPRRTKSACKIGVSAPYAMEDIDAALGRRDSTERRLPPCR